MHTSAAHQGDGRWGLSAPEWAEAKASLIELLREAAESRSTVTYGEVSQRVFGGRFSARSSALMDLLGEVDEETKARTGVIVASLVVRADTGLPGDGYFVFVERLIGGPVDDRREFWRNEAERVWEMAGTL